ncbi:MAG: hypothetical protein E4H26_05200 [Flavobacteriales bacterium]|nr:MAG: hypothetical protein E4H26_05200 [Flavobacteriales bacterium]
MKCLSQEIRIFTTTDFDLKGEVKLCLITTDYGKEEYDFDKEGRLTKSVTRYNEGDYDITYYFYDDGELTEKRLENYRNKELDRSTSIANFYTIDTTENKLVTEKIISYDKVFLDQYQYLYDADNKVANIIRSNNNGNDETILEYSSLKNENTINYMLNGVLQKSVRTSERTAKNKTKEKVVLTKEYLNGVPNIANEEVFDPREKRIEITRYVFDSKTGQFAPNSISKFTYNEDGDLTKSETKNGKKIEVKEYIYQFDNEKSGNWVKQIIKPENSYTSRKIIYYENDKVAVEH